MRRKQTKEKKWPKMLLIFVILTAVAVYSGYLLSQHIFNAFYWYDDEETVGSGEPNISPPQDNEDSGLPYPDVGIGDEDEEPDNPVEEEEPSDPVDEDNSPDAGVDQPPVENPNDEEQGDNEPGSPATAINFSVSEFTYYQVQVGSFSVRENAQLLVDDLADKGYLAVIRTYAHEGNTFYQVRAEISTSEEHAKSLGADYEALELPIWVKKENHSAKVVTLHSKTDNNSRQELETSISDFQTLLNQWTEYQQGNLSLNEFTNSAHQLAQHSSSLITYVNNLEDSVSRNELSNLYEILSQMDNVASKAKFEEVLQKCIHAYNILVS